MDQCTRLNFTAQGWLPGQGCQARLPNGLSSAWSSIGRSSPEMLAEKEMAGLTDQGLLFAACCHSSTNQEYDRSLHASMTSSKMLWIPWTHSSQTHTKSHSGSYSSTPGHTIPPNASSRLFQSWHSPFGPSSDQTVCSWWCCALCAECPAKPTTPRSSQERLQI